MIPTFPQSPALIADKSSIKPVSRARITQFENGIDKQHVMHSRQMVERDVSFYCCDIECCEELRLFFRDDCANATSWFLFHSPWHANADRAGVIRARVKGGDVEFSPETADFSAWMVKFTIQWYE